MPLSPQNIAKLYFSDWYSFLTCGSLSFESCVRWHLRQACKCAHHLLSNHCCWLNDGVAPVFQQYFGNTVDISLDFTFSLHSQPAERKHSGDCFLVFCCYRRKGMFMICWAFLRARITWKGHFNRNVHSGWSLLLSALFIKCSMILSFRHQSNYIMVKFVLKVS